MKTYLKMFSLLFLAGILVVACSKDNKEEMATTVNESLKKEVGVQELINQESRIAPDLIKFETKLIAAAERVRKTNPAASRNSDDKWIPGIVKSKVKRLYPDANIVDSYSYISIPGHSYKHYSVMLDNGMELVYFESGDLMAEATVEEVYGDKELKAGELSWGILMRLMYVLEDEIVEEAIIGMKDDLRQLDYMDKSRMVLSTKGQVISTGVDRQGDDEGKVTVNSDGTITSTSSSSSFDDDDNGADVDDDGPGDNDDGDGDDDDGVAGNQDDDDDGLGDNDDGIAGNQDDDDNGNGDNDDGVSGNNSNHIDPATLPATIRNYIATNYPTATIIQAEQYTNRYEVNLNTGVELYFDLNGNLLGTSNGGDDDDDGVNDNDDDDDGISGNDDDDDGLGDNDDGDGDDDDGVSGNGNTIAPSSLPAAIQNYIATNYPTATITKAEQYTNRYEVNLNTGIELYFDLNGNLIGTSGNNGDDDDDGFGGNDNDDDDDGISGNDDDDDDGIGNGNNDDDDDGLGDNDDGIAGNQDNDDNGNGDNDDGVAGNNGDDDDDGLGDNDDGIAGNQDNDDNGNGDNDDGVSGNGNTIAPSSLPAAIQNYIATNYPTATITKAEQYTSRYEVNLSTGIELYFDLNGNLLGTSGNNGGDDDDDGPSDDDDDGTGNDDDDN